MKIIIFIIIFLIIIGYVSRENFKEYNSLEIEPIGINYNDKKEQIKKVTNELESKEIKKYSFQTDSIIPVLEQNEISLITQYLKRHFPLFLEIVRFKKEQQDDIKRYNVVFTMKDETNSYNHVVLSKIMIKNGSIFFNNLEYGGMVLPTELSPKQKGEELFFINESENKVVFLDKQIENELDKFEKRKIEILLRRGRKAV